MNHRISLLIGLIILSALGFVIWGMFPEAPEPRLNQPITDVTDSISNKTPTLESVAKNLGQIWALDVLPNGNILATQNEGSLLLVDTNTGQTQEISNLPEVDSRGQGGLLDITISPDFQTNSTVYITYTDSNDTGKTTTHLASGRINLETNTLEDVQVLFIAEPFLDSTAHYGSRVIEQDKYLFLTIGDRGNKDFENHPSQDTTNVLGTTARLNLDGSIPADNPFVDTPNFHPAIYTYGHRNVQGMAIQPETGAIWQSEHGEQDGDRINRLETGANFGWPETHSGCTYLTGRSIGVPHSERADVPNPAFDWDCGSGGFPPAGMTFYDGDTFPEWQGNLFVGGLASRYLGHFRETSPGVLEELPPLLKEEGWRIRDVVVHPLDGGLYLAVEGGEDSIVRIVGK